MDRKAHLIFDIPASEDAFDGGGHKRSAKALAEAIKQLKDKNGSIGLEGQWGSGKSTVINLAEKELSENSEGDTHYFIFPFDLWEHQSDDFRRAFLEEFVNWLQVNSHLTSKEAEKEKDKIRDRVKVVKSHNHKEYSIFGSIFILLSPLIPLIYSWMSPAGFNAPSGQGTVNEFLGIPPWELGIYIFASAYAAFLIRVAILFDQPERDNYDTIIKSKGDCVKKLSSSVSKAISMFTKDVEKEETKQNIRESDPTTIEFHGIFKDLLSKVQAKNRRIIFVLDNIDRLPEDCVSLIWSEVRSLFSNSSFKDKDRNSFVTAVVPYDKNFIEKAFNIKYEQTSDSNSGSDVFSKTFSVILRVAPPVATDWAIFLKSRLNEAFKPNFEDNTITRIFGILKYSFQKQKIHPTPRRIITFVNEMVSLWLQWGEIIQPESIALYILYRNQIEHNPVALLTNIMDERFLQITGVSDWQKDFAALSLNVHPKDGYQILLKQPVIGALTESNPNKLLKLEESKGFREVFDDALEEAINNAGTKNPTVLANISRNVQSIKLETALMGASLRRMAQALEELEDLDIGNNDVFEGLLTIVSGQDKTQIMNMAKTFREKIFEYSITLFDLAENAHNAGQKWLMAISKIGEVILQSLGDDKQSTFFKETTIPEGTEFALGVAYACSKKRRPDFKDLILETKPKEIIQSLNVPSKIASSEDAEIFNSTLSQLASLMDDADRNSLINLVAERLRMDGDPEETMTCDLLNAFIDLYSDVKEKNSAREVVNSLVVDGTLAWHAYYGYQYDKFEALGLAQWLITEVSEANQNPITSNEPHSEFGDLSEIKQWYAEAITESVVELEQLEMLSKLVSKSNKLYKWILLGQTSEFFKSVSVHIVKKGKLGRLNVESCIFDYDKIKLVLGEDISLKFLKILSGWGKHFSEKFLNESVLKISDDFLEDVYKLEDKTAYEIILKKIDDFLKDISLEDWRDVFDKEDDRIRLLLIRQKTDNITFVEPYKSALLEHSSQILEGNKFPKKYSSDWDKVLNALKSANQKKLAEDLLNTLDKLTTTTAGSENFIYLYNGLAELIPYNKSPDVSLDKVFSKLITSGEDDTRNFVRKKIKDIKECIKNASETSIDSFEETIVSLEESGSDDETVWAEELRKLLELKSKKVQEIDKSEEDSKT